MLPQISISTLVLAALATAQSQLSTPPGFKPEVKDRLDLIVGSKVITVPGTSLTKAGELSIGLFLSLENLHKYNGLRGNYW